MGRVKRNPSIGALGGTPDGFRCALPILPGYLAAYAHVFLADAALSAPVLKGWAVLYPRFSLIPTVDGLQVATLFFSLDLHFGGTRSGSIGLGKQGSNRRSH